MKILAVVLFGIFALWLLVKATVTDIWGYKNRTQDLEGSILLLICLWWLPVFVAILLLLASCCYPLAKQ